MAWFLNQMLHFDFIRTRFTIKDREGNAHDYPLFKFHDSKHHLNYLLLNNLSDNIPLIKQYKQFNMFMLVEGYLDLFDETDFIAKLQSVESIQLIASIDIAPFKKHQYTLFEN